MDELNNKHDEEEPQENSSETEGKNDVNPLWIRIYPKISPVSAAVIGLLGGFFLYQIVGGILTLLVFGFDIKSAPVNSMRLMTMAGQILFILLPALIFSKAVYEDVTHIIRFHPPKFKEILLFTAGIIILMPLLQYYLSIQNYLINILAEASPFVHTVKTFLDKLNDMVDKTYGNLLSVHSVIDGILVILVVSVVPAICEETMFRGFIQRSFEFKMKPVWAALITAVFFGIYHFNPYALIPLIILGFYFGFAAYMSDSIFVPMSMHFLNNFISVILFFIYGDDDVLNSTLNKDFKPETAILQFLVLAVLFVAVIIFIRKYYSNEKKN